MRKGYVKFLLKVSFHADNHRKLRANLLSNVDQLNSEINSEPTGAPWQ